MNFTQQKSCLSRKLLGRIGAGGVTQVRSIPEYSMWFLSVCMSSTNPCGALHQDTLLCLETAINGSLSLDGSTPYSAVDFTAGYPTRHLMDVWVCTSCGSVYSCSIVIQSDKLTPWVTLRLQHTSIASLYDLKQYWAENIIFSKTQPGFRLGHSIAAAFTFEDYDLFLGTLIDTGLSEGVIWCFRSYLADLTLCVSVKRFPVKIPGSLQRSPSWLHFRPSLSLFLFIYISINEIWDNIFLS